jgi:hypothetical protein
MVFAESCLRNSDQLSAISRQLKNRIIFAESWLKNSD